ncbi:uncharacterized protein BDZ99DRAFT_463419 [Mytilinidion resinicola]|uniref:DUF7918 domain-containing protein n=1 Tax=Mytilinidion resinicola TaxID=574789 RepID=A0A6A6YNT2_9PEZI|nr:uncharacterized protein BDZ99DRAFT_463419 [Mytilinidion resinicola]KAF2809635.1 hypothetical protein BDZ99DRAFT_463419 [Mytilinidion resinicola]
MAILDDLLGLKVEIVVNGQPLQEYDDEDGEEEKPKSVIKYIEATSNATFEVRVIFGLELPQEHRQYSYTCRVYLDGTYQDGMVFEKRTGLFKQATLRGRRSCKAGEYYLQTFRFSNLTIDDGDLNAVGQGVKDALNQVGEISVTFQRMHYGGDVAPIEKSPFTQPSHLGTIPEKVLKGRAISHQATLATPQTVPAFREVIGEYVDTVKSPFATFNFRYRSRDALKALHIIPRSASPVALEDRPVEDLTPEELRELVKRQRERDAISAHKVKREKIEREKIKRERTENRSGSFEGDDDLVVVEERPRKRYRTVIEEDGVETVDLT